MKSLFPIVPLGRVVRHRKEFIEIDDSKTYKRCRVQLHARGVVERDTVLGAEIKTKRQQVCRAGELIVAEIDAKHGGFGIVPAELDGAIVSSHYFLFTVDESILDRRFLGYVLRTRAFRDQVEAQGSTNYAAIRPQDVLSYVIPLPPLDEQRRIVARIEELVAKIEEAQRLRREADDDLDALLISMAHRRDLDSGEKRRAGWVEVAVGEVVQQVADIHAVDPAAVYPNLGVLSFGRGLFKKPPIEGSSTRTRTLFRVRAGQFIYSRLFAFEGAYAYVPDEFDHYYVSNEFPTFECDGDRVRAEFLAAYFKDPAVWRQVAAGSKGLGDRRQRVHPDQVLAHRFMLPPLQWQERVAEVTRKIQELRRVQAVSALGLGALLPSLLNKAFNGEL